MFHAGILPPLVVYGLLLISLALTTNSVEGSFSAPTDTTQISSPKKIYMAVYKPALMLCKLAIDDGHRDARKRRERRKTLANLRADDGRNLLDATATTEAGNRLHTVGRLDRDSEGLLLLTNDGQFTHKVLSEGCQKTYWALVKGSPNQAAMDEMRRGGLQIRKVITRPPVSVRILPEEERIKSLLPDPTVPNMIREGTWIEMILTEGRHRQVRRVTNAAGHKTIRLVRVAIGSLRLGSMQPGDCRMINARQVIKYDG